MTPHTPDGATAATSVETSTSPITSPKGDDKSRNLNGSSTAAKPSSPIKGDDSDVVRMAAVSKAKGMANTTISTTTNVAQPAVTSQATAVRYPAPSVGLPVPLSFTNALLNLEVKVLTQALGAENQWVEQGDGRVSFCNFTIRVTANHTSAEASLKEKKSDEGPACASSPGTTDSDPATPAATASTPKSSGAADKGASTTTVDSSTVSEEEEMEEGEEQILLEDTITNDTPFVGENCCIVWNSFEKQLSLCLMYASEEGYAASWSALVALQDKSYPPFRYDLLERCRSVAERRVAAEAAALSGLSPATPITESAPNSAEVVLPYEYFIHDHHVPPLGFIEQHALSLSIMEHQHALNPVIYTHKETVMAMLSIANPDLLDYLITPACFPLLLSGLRCGSGPEEWTVPPALQGLPVAVGVTTAIAKDRRIGFLQESVLPICCEGEMRTELAAKYATLSRRLRNDIVCGLLTTDAIFLQATAALRIAPPLMPPNGTPTTSSLSRNRGNSTDSGLGASLNSLCSSASPAPPPPSVSSELVAQAQKAEQQVLAHLRFFREVVTLSITELGREMVGPVVGKVLQCGLLDALSLVAERFAMPPNATAAFAKRLSESGGTGSGSGGGLNGGRRNGSSATATVAPPSLAGGANYYSPAVEQELAALLDKTLVRMNERQEEQVMNDQVRAPILAEPLKYNGLVTFMVRQLVVGGTSTGSPRTANGGFFPPPRRILRDTMASTNPYPLFHVLGLHDDEGSAAAERVMDPNSSLLRNQFHTFIITRYLAYATRGIMPPVPLPPALGGMLGRNAPIVRFDNAGTSGAQRGGAVGITGADVGGGASGIAGAVGDAGGLAEYTNENSMSTGPIGVPHSGVVVASSRLGSDSTNGGVFVGSGRGGAAAKASTPPPLPTGLTPALLRVLEYLIELTSDSNRELLLKMAFHNKSHVLHFIENTCEVLCCGDGMGGRCLVGLDVLCGCVRFIKVVIAQVARTPAEVDESPISSYATSAELLSPTLTTTICRQLTVERDTFGFLLRAYNKLGGLRRNTVFHSSFLSVLDLISKTSGKHSEEQSGSTLRDVRDFLFYKHFSRLPELFARRFRQSLLDEVCVRLGRESASRSPNDSVSILSSTAGSELLRSSSKLRFVDEVEAVAGGVDGTVVAGSVMSPAMVATMASAEEKQRKRSGRAALDQWAASAHHAMPVATTALGGTNSGTAHTALRSLAPLTLSDGSKTRSPPPSASPSTGRSSPPMTISIARPAGASSSGSTSPAATESPSSMEGTPGCEVPSPTTKTGESAIDTAASAFPADVQLTVIATAKDGEVSVNGKPSEGGANGVGSSNVSPPLKPTAPKNERPPGRPRTFASVVDGSVKSGDAGGGGKSRSMPNVTSGTLSPSASPEDGQLSNSALVKPSSPLTRANSSGEAAVGTIPISASAHSDSVVLPKIKKRGSNSGKRT